jgi:hypothetical protein
MIPDAVRLLALIVLHKKFQIQSTTCLKGSLLEVIMQIRVKTGHKNINYGNEIYYCQAKQSRYGKLTDQEN